METLWSDIRYALRTLARNPAFVIVAICALALGIGANTAIFSIVNAALLRPLPYPHPEQLVKIKMRFVGIGIPGDLNWVSAPEFTDVRNMNRSFADLAAIDFANANLTGHGLPQRVQAAVVSPSFFSALGVQPELGRAFLPDEEQPGHDKVVLLSDHLWRLRFGADPQIVGSSISINGNPYIVAGILPAGFQYPEDIDIWAPLAFKPDDLKADQRGSHGLEVLARVKPGISLEQARADMAAVSARMIRENPAYPYAQFHFGVVLVPLIQEYVGDIRLALWILLGAVGFVLLIACANVANLLLVRASAREKELAIRTALGAGRGRLIRQLLTESIVLAIAGGAAGLLFASVSLQMLTSVAAASFPRVAAARIDVPVLLFTLLISVATGILFGLWPALHASRSVPHESLKEGGRTGTAAGSQRARQTLIVAEMALSLVLLAGAGLLIRSFLRLQEVDPGFRAENVLTMRIALPEERYAKDSQVLTFYNTLLDRVRALPGVKAAGAVSNLPLTSQGGSGTTTIDTTAVPPQDRTPEADQRVATPGYFDALQIRLLKGRYFEARDTDTSQPVAIVDETLAAKYWPNEDAIGKRVKLGGDGSKSPWMTVVGVVHHVRHYTLESNARVTVYVPLTQLPLRTLSLAIRTTGDPRLLTPTVEREVLAVDPDQPVYGTKTMEDILEGSVARRRLSMLLLAIFAGAALVLAAVGIYGVISYAVAQRAHEVGLRVALGAAPRHIRTMILGQSMQLAGVGVLAGLLGSVLLTGFMRGMLFDVNAWDPITFVAVACALFAVAMLASYVPAWRATRVDPVEALRQE